MQILKKVTVYILFETRPIEGGDPRFCYGFIGVWGSRRGAENYRQALIEYYPEKEIIISDFDVTVPIGHRV